MGLGDKCCCLIPLRLGTFFIAIWFFALYLVYATTGFVGVNSIAFYSGQSAKPWFYISMLFTVAICLGGLCGIIGSMFASKRFSKAFSIIVWINCILSSLNWIISVILIGVNIQNAINSCTVVGFVSASNPQYNMSPVMFNQNNASYYSPVKYQGLLTQNAMSKSDCTQTLKAMTILFGVLAFVVQIVQFYFAYVVNVYAKRLQNGARHHRLHAQQIKDFEESRYHMSTVY